MALPFPEGQSADERIAFVDEARRRIGELLSVEAAAVTTTNPLLQSGFVNTVTPEDHVESAPFQGLKSVGWRSVTTGFFDETDGDGTSRVMPADESVDDLVADPPVGHFKAVGVQGFQ